MQLLNESTGIYLNAAKNFKGEFIHTVKVRKKNGVMPQNTQCTMFNIYQFKSNVTMVMIYIEFSVQAIYDSIRIGDKETKWWRKRYIGYVMMILIWQKK